MASRFWRVMLNHAIKRSRCRIIALGFCILWHAALLLVLFELGKSHKLPNKLFLTAIEAVVCASHLGVRYAKS